MPALGGAQGASIERKKEKRRKERKLIKLVDDDHLYTYIITVYIYI